MFPFISTIKAPISAIRIALGVVCHSQDQSYTCSKRTKSIHIVNAFDTSYLMWKITDFSSFQEMREICMEIIGATPDPFKVLQFSANLG